MRSLFLALAFLSVAFALECYMGMFSIETALNNETLYFLNEPKNEGQQRIKMKKNWGFWEKDESKKYGMKMKLFIGMIPKGTTATPQLKQCADNAKCCYYNKYVFTNFRTSAVTTFRHSVKGKFYHCESKCPDFKGNVFISKVSKILLTIIINIKFI